METITFKPKQITKILLSPLQDRSREVIFSRFGLTPDSSRKTLEMIGNKYNITRERVRQIETAALNTIRKSEAFQDCQHVFQELKDTIDSLGKVTVEDKLLFFISNNKNIQNHIRLYLVLGDDFTKHKEDDYFKSRWNIDEDVTKAVINALQELYESLNNEDIIPEDEIISRFLNGLKGISEQYKNEDNVLNWLLISKVIDKNPLGEWGLNSSPNVRAKGVKAYAFLALRKNGSPMHFTEVANTITETFDRKTHPATCHNELIKDGRFVLVGRGTYGLAEWGYKKGIVSDVIRQILKEEGPLSKEEVVDLVLKERFLKQNTILVNLQNRKYFKKTKDGLYTIK